MIEFIGQMGFKRGHLGQLGPNICDNVSLETVVILGEFVKLKNLS